MVLFPTFQLAREPFLWQALVLSLLLITITPLSVGPNWKLQQIREMENSLVSKNQNKSNCNFLQRSPKK